MHVPLKEYESNLRQIVRHLESAAQHVILITPPPVHEAGRLEFQRRKYGDAATGVLERTNARAGEYAAACSRVAQVRIATLADEQWQDLQLISIDFPDFYIVFVVFFHACKTGARLLNVHVQFMVVFYAMYVRMCTES